VGGEGGFLGGENRGFWRRLVGARKDTVFCWFVWQGQEKKKRDNRKEGEGRIGDLGEEGREIFLSNTQKKKVI